MHRVPEKLTFLGRLRQAWFLARVGLDSRYRVIPGEFVEAVSTSLPPKQLLSELFPGSCTMEAYAVVRQLLAQHRQALVRVVEAELSWECFGEMAEAIWEDQELHEIRAWRDHQ